MKMKKQLWILWSAMLAVVVAVTIIAPVSKTTMTFAVACLGTAAMFAMAAYAFQVSFAQEEMKKSKLLGWPFFQVALGTLMTQIVLHFVLLALSAVCPWIVAALLELAVMCLAAYSMTEYDPAAEAEEQRRALAAANEQWKAVCTRAARIAAATGNAELKRFAEELTQADPTPTAMDAEIASMLEILSSYADAANIRKAFAMLEQRNALLQEGGQDA